MTTAFITTEFAPMQAALAPMTFEQAQTSGDPRDIEVATDLVRMSVVAIILLAPLGAILMMTTGPILLNKISDEENRRNRQLSYLQIRSLQPVRQRNFPDSE